jgi:transcriptional antiterminator NusG
VDGPFVDFTGLVQEVNAEKQKVTVLISVFGRSTPVELEYLQVEHEK